MRSESVEQTQTERRAEAGKFGPPHFGGRRGAVGDSAGVLQGGCAVRNRVVRFICPRDARLLPGGLSAAVWRVHRVRDGGLNPVFFSLFLLPGDLFPEGTGCKYCVFRLMSMFTSSTTWVEALYSRYLKSGSRQEAGGRKEDRQERVAEDAGGCHHGAGDWDFKELRGRPWGLRKYEGECLQGRHSPLNSRIRSGGERDKKNRREERYEGHGSAGCGRRVCRWGKVLIVPGCRPSDSNPRKLVE